VVTNIEVLEHIEDKYIPDFIKALYEKTSHGGFIIICVPTKNTPVPPLHFRHYDINLLTKQIEDSGVNLSIVDTCYVGKKHFFIDRILGRFLYNKYWTFDIKYISKRIWRKFWNKLRYANERTGKHLIVTFKKGDRV
jgi:hypothetical protein